MTALESKKGPLRPEAWRTTESRKRASGPLLLETRRHGWNNQGLACDFARNLAKQGIASWSDVSQWGTGEVLTWRQMKRVYGLRDNTTEHSEYTRLAEQLMRTRVGAAAKGVEVGGNRKARTRTGDEMEGARQGAEGGGSKEGADLLRGGREEDGHGWYYHCEWEGEQSDSWVWHDKMASVGYVGDLANTWGGAGQRLRTRQKNK